MITIYLVNKNNYIRSLEADISQCYSDFNKEYNSDYYFSKRNYHKWKKGHTKLIPKIYEVNTHIKRIEKGTKRFDPFNELIMLYFTYFIIKKEYSDKVKHLVHIIENGYEVLKDRNIKFIEKEKEVFSELFLSVDGKQLTNQQMDSVIVDEASNLVIVGAGAGKTLSLLGKIKYIEAKGFANPDEILILSFLKRVRKELTEKITENFGDKYEVRTFHSFGLSIIGKVTGELPAVASVSTDADVMRNKIQEFLRERMKEVRFANLVNKYFSFYLNPVENKLDISSAEEYDNYIKTLNIRSLKGDLVKSFEECEIANFLYLNQVPYQYEKEYDYPSASEKHQQYTPDFYIENYGIWLEHIGIDRNCNTAPDVPRWDYLDSWYWKRQTHKQNGTECLETYSYQHQEGALFDSLTDMLTVRGVVFQQLPSELVYQRLQSLGEVSLFVGLLSKFLTLFKSSTLTIEALRTKASMSKYSQRYNAFLDIFEPIYHDYTNHLKSIGKIDFDDMINNAVKHIRSGAYQSKYKYILVDDFQDISQSRYRLVKALLDSNPESHIDCVGDDWQSIYRFAGSDLSIMTSFDKYFEYTEKIFLEESFRFNDKIADFSSKFIMKNPSQYEKNIESKSSEEDSVFVVWYDDLNTAMEKVLNKIYTQRPTANVYVLGRYGQGYYKNLDSSFFTSNDSYQTKIIENYSNLDVQYSTIHGVKGSQRDYVILIGVRSGNYGLPCEIEDDPILNLVLAEDDTFPFGEERRIFYVGVTRAVNQVYILADKGKISSFVEEIVDKDSDYAVTEFGDKPIKCPLCEDGYLVFVKGTPDFYGCSNYWINGCTYKEQIPTKEELREKTPEELKPKQWEIESIRREFINYMSKKGVENRILAAEWLSNYGIKYLEAKKLIEQWVLKGLIEEKGDYHIQFPSEE